MCSLVFLGFLPSCFYTFPAPVSVSFLSAFVSFCWSRFLFPPVAYIVKHLLFLVSCSFRLQILLHPFCIFHWRFRFPAWSFWNEAKMKARKGKIHDKLAAGMCFFSTSKAPAPPPGRRWLVLAPLANLHPSICVWALGTAYSWNISHMYNLQKKTKATLLLQFWRPPKIWFPYLFFVAYKGPPSFYRGLGQTFTNICAVPCGHHFSKLATAAAMAVMVQNNAGSRDSYCNR